MPHTLEIKFGTGYKEAFRCEASGFSTERVKLYEEADRKGGRSRVTVPVIETYTGQNMLIDFQYANKLCSCEKEEVDRGNHCPSCTANFPLADSIGNAEGELARRAVVDMQGDPQNPVLLEKVLTDNDSYSLKKEVLRNVEATGKEYRSTGTKSVV
ncbi:hypothetical protein Bbelb_082620 [Branchiostoma belcheri]|nr:hypothetical protein Bbelb_082620 [Branchiostoma belcheri]